MQAKVTRMRRAVFKMLSLIQTVCNTLLLQACFHIVRRVDSHHRLRTVADREGRKKRNSAATVLSPPRRAALPCNHHFRSSATCASSSSSRLHRLHSHRCNNEHHHAGKQHQSPSAAQPGRRVWKWNPNSGKCTLRHVSASDRIVKLVNWSTLVKWSKSAVNSGQNCKYG